MWFAAYMALGAIYTAVLLGRVRFPDNPPDWAVYVTALTVMLAWPGCMASRYLFGRRVFG